MKKFNALLHDVTLINFAFVLKLAGRYRSISTLAGAVFVLLSLFFYFGQATVYSKKVYFKMQPQEDSTSLKKIAEIAGDAAEEFINQNEVKAIVTNFKFTSLLARKIVESSHFERLDFNNPRANSFRNHADLFSGCGDKECKIKSLEGVLSGLYEIDSEIGTGRFVLTVTTRSELTTTEFIRHFIEAIKENRLNVAIEEYDKKIAHTIELIQASRSDVYSKGGFEKVAAIETLEASIARQHEKMRDIIIRLNGEIHQNHFQEVRLKTTEVTANSELESQSKAGYELYQTLVKTIARTKKNIEALSLIPEESKSPSDRVILAQLQDELKRKQAELRGLGRISRNLAHEQKFIESQMSNQTDYEFDYAITRQKVKKLQSESAKAKTDLTQLLSEKAKLDNELLALKPDLEYLKKMESKLVGLRMLKSGARSNVLFEEYGPEVSTFKRNSIVKTMLFSLFLVAFFLFLGLVLVYWFDDRIFDEKEFEQCFNELGVVGHTPKFK